MFDLSMQFYTGLLQNLETYQENLPDPMFFFHLFQVSFPPCFYSCLCSLSLSFIVSFFLVSILLCAVIFLRLSLSAFLLVSPVNFFILFFSASLLPFTISLLLHFLFCILPLFVSSILPLFLTFFLTVCNSVSGIPGINQVKENAGFYTC